MKNGLRSLPAIHDLERAYQATLRFEKNKKELLPISSLAQFSMWARFDSRMGEICVRYLCGHWRKINPLDLRDAFLSTPWPGVLGVFLEFVERKLISSLDPSELELFRMWKKTATCGYLKVNWEQFYIGKRRVAGQLMFDDARLSLEEYRKWGYLAREVLINKPDEVQERTRHSNFSYSSETRLQILSILMEKHERITVGLYWNALGKSVSKRQAERDLASFPGLRAIGKTRGRYFIRNKR